MRNYYSGLWPGSSVLLCEEGRYKGSFKLPIAFVAAFTRGNEEDIGDRRS